MNTTHSPSDAFENAVKLVGGQSALARLCGKSQATVWKWVKNNRLPAEYVLKVEAATGVSRHLLRPDIYPVETPFAPPAFHGVDRGEARVSFQNGTVLQRNNGLEAVA